MRYPCIMTNEDAEQLALDGLAPRKRRKRAPAVKTPAAEHPIAQVVLDIQAAHLGQTFDYFVEEKYSAAAQPGVMVRVRFGGQRVNGIIWKRADTSATPESSIRYIERVVTDRVLVPESMRDDMTRIADAFGGTRANILRLAVPPRVAKVESQLRVGNRDAAGTAAGKQRLAAVDQEIYGQLQRQYGNINLLHDALQGRRFQSFVFDLLPGADHWRRCAAWMVAAALAQNKPAVLVLPTMREIADMTETLRSVGLKPFAPTGAANGVYDGDFAVLNAQMAPADRYRAYLAISCGQVRCVLGTRAAMYAPVEGNALFLILDDVCYQDADGMMPYANARGVLRLRAKSHNGVFVAMANARSVQSQWETMDSLAQSRRAGTTRRSDHRRTRATHRGPDTVQSFGNRSGAAVHTAGRHHRSVKLLEMPPPSAMRALHGTIGTVGGRNDSMPLVRRCHRAMVMPDMP